MTVIITSAIIATGLFYSSRPKTQPSVFSAASSKIAAYAYTPLSIQIPTADRRRLERNSPPSTPPMLSPSASSTSSFDDGNPLAEILSSMANANSARRKSQEYFFPNQTTFESAVPHVVRAKDVVLKDHPHVEGAYAEYDELYNADSLVTKDGRHMVRLL
ncbi:hypothetical protein EC957_003802 [Mortierella hygrophila]|uniref:Uncharacterized protein n=1 Tax=Mortierella hygrophila TaxID=979708 RepID=A0A9P6FF83_9FUNG|nr:hypothetical protein EC957_003802 [Mortierella hygrophila]